MRKLGKRIIAGATIASALTVATLAGKGVLVDAASEYYNEIYYSTVIPDAYYTGVDTSLSGEEFIANLQPIISKNYNQHSYTANSTVLKYTDPDPKHPGNVIGFYSGDSISSGSWNKEHVWAKSHGFPNKGDQPYCDAHHLRPTYNNINSSRGNKDFGESTATPDRYGNKSGDVFEPRDEVKGDVARIMFYMATRYSESHNLKLVKDRITSTSDTNGRFGGLDTLLKWHYQDPVSKEEVYRNNVIYENYQHNRNPYIDHPEYVDLAYPNEYASYEVDQAKVDNVKNLIDALPTNIELSHKNQVNAANDAYLALNFKEKQAVANYSKLEAALNRIYELDKPVNPNPKPEPTPDPETKPDTPIVPHDGALSIDFTVNNLGNIGYTNDAVIDMGGNKLYMSSYMAAKDQSWGPDCIRLGNKNAIDLAIVGASGKGHYMEPQFDMDAVKSMSLNIVQSFSGYDSWEVTFKDKETGTYESIATGTGNEIKAELPEARNGHFVVCVKGEKPRCDLGVLNIYTEAKDVAFEKLSIEASIIAKYQKGAITTAKLRLGGALEDESLANAAGYGIIVMPATNLTEGTIKNQLKNITPADLKSNDSYLVTPLKDIAYVNGNKHQFAIVGDVTGNEGLELVACAYMELDGKLYFTLDTKASFKTAANAYANTLEDANKNLLLGLLAKLN